VSSDDQIRLTLQDVEGPTAGPTDNPWNKPLDPCSICTLFLEPGPVRATGSTNAPILYVAEAPGAEEVDHPWGYDIVKHGPPGPGVAGGWRPSRFAPLIGGSGKILSAILANAGISRKKDVRLTNVVKCRPPGNRLPTKGEIACCATFLIKEIEEGEQNVIVAAGEIALNTLTDKEKIGLWRGVPTEGFGKRKVFPTWHPAFIARAQYNWPFAVHDMARAKTESAFPDIVRTPVVVIRNASVTVDRDGLLAAARKRGALTFDFETSGLSAERDSILMCGFVARPDESRVYDWTTGTQRFFQEVLDDPALTIIGQNILNFDLPFAEEKGFTIPWTRIFDTMTAFHLANSSYGQTPVSGQQWGSGARGARGAEKDLAFIASNHTDIEYWKSKQAYGSDLKGVCGLDCVATDRSATHPTTGLIQELESYDMTDLYWKHVLPVHPILKRMTKRGVRIDMDRALRWKTIIDRTADQKEVELGKEFPGLNLQSPQQLMDLLYNKLKLPVQTIDDKKKGKPRPTANAEALEFLAETYPQHAVLQNIVTIRHLRKMGSTYVDPGLRGDGFLHPSFGVSKASTGRFNSWNPNAQNVPEEMRDIWIPDSPDHVLISADWSQIEWRLAMVLSADVVGLELLASGVDNHRAVASETLGIPLESVTDGQRHSAKFIVYGLGYGRGVQSIAESLVQQGVFKDYASAFAFVSNFVGRFFKRFKIFADWRERNVAFVKKNRFLANSFKRRRWWYTYQVTEVYNFPQQSTAADMMYDAIIDLDRELPKAATLRLTVHDETVTNSPKDSVRESVRAIRDNMQRTWDSIVDTSADPDVVRSFYPNGWYCPVDIHIGTNWRMCKSKDPEDKRKREELEKYFGLAA
jgi:uracil-DNA glycosylase family 4